MKTSSYPASSKRLSQQALELSIATPQVVAQRLTRMAFAGPNMSAQDQKEFKQMSDEKVTAFYQSWNAIWVQMFKSQFALAQVMVSTFTAAAVAGKSPCVTSAISAMSNEVNKIMSAGIEPVHRQAVSNARRLSRNR
ncbi:polyhydroxyalkanoate granule-associated phasin [Limnobacter parvus]|uniref:Phasin domain-containing protein n=1 Tax=Limnobacter parvus TaxID=2939690 RepID=A0ABT1XF11_9BURK|nr:polyhydroxyalkanoate granule-associated phasin [Limnobacter parvus]MCR2745873.1 hypothetical protein [Limnobacter parvus]